MLNEQVIGMLQNNAGNPEIVKRIAEENQLSQTEISQALKIPEEAAARYMPAMGQSPADLAGAASNAIGAPFGGGMAANTNAVGGMATGNLANQPGISSPPPAVGSVPAVTPVAASPMGQMADTMQKPMIAEPPLQMEQKPAKLPAGMKPQGMEEPVAKPGQMAEKPAARPGGVPSLPRIQRGGRFAGDGEQAFVDAFNRLRGSLQ